MNMEKSVIEVEIPVNLNIDNAVARIKIVHDKEPILAFVQVDLGFITIKGITVKERDFNGDGNKVLVFDLPAYKAGFNYIKSVFISDKRIFSEISRAVLSKVQEELGNAKTYEEYSEEEVNPDDIPF